MDEETKDVIKGVGKVGLAAIFPIAAPLFFSIYEELYNGEYKRRLEDFIEKTEHNFEMLRETVLEHLKENKLFATVLTISGHLAAKTNDEKRTMLANAVANSAETILSEDEVIILLNCFEKYTLGHLCLLRFLQNPDDAPHENDMFVSPMTLYYRCYPERKNEALNNIIIHDLFHDGMISTDSLNTSCTVQGAISKHTTDLGDKMIDFFGIEKFPQEVQCCLKSV